MAGTSRTSASPIRDFKDLEVWRAARGLRKDIYRVAPPLPDFEKFGLASQLRRATTSVAAKLTEGFGRFG
jgi:four helix bundle protein